MKNNATSAWLPSQKLIIRIMIVIIVVLAVSCGYFASLAQNQAGNQILILKYLNVMNTKELMNTKWEKK